MCSGYSMVIFWQLHFCCSFLFLDNPSFSSFLTVVFFRAKWCMVFGTKYKKGAAVHTGGDGLLPQFSLIDKIVTVPGKDASQVFFVLKEIVTHNYEVHLHAYHVKVLNDGAVTVRSQEELTTFRPLHICRSIGDNQSSFICSKSDVDVYNEQI